MNRLAAPALTAICLTAAVVIVAMVARAPLARSSPVNAASAGAPATVLFVLLAGVGVVALTALATLLWVTRRRRTDDEPERAVEPPQVHWLWKLAAIVLPLALGAVLVLAALSQPRRALNPARLGGVPVGGAGTLRHRGGGPRGFVLPSWLPWTVLAIILAAVVAGVALLVVLLVVRRRARPEPEGCSERGAVQAAIEAATGALQTASDPRAAVIAAYAAMERALAARGVARARAEAPREYLRRALGAAGGAESEARTLTALFEEARYSTHPIPARIRDRARSALSRLRAQLEAVDAG